MGIFSSANGEDVLIDKLIGSAYERVRHVAANISIISYLADSLKGVGVEEPVLLLATTKLTGSTGQLGATVLVDLPADCDLTKLLDVSVKVTGTDGIVYFNDSRYFHAHVAANKKLVVELLNSAPVTMRLAPLKALLTFES